MTRETKIGTRNFRSKAGYRKWLAFGHIHGQFKKTPGNQVVKIAGRIRRVVHRKIKI